MKQVKENVIAIRVTKELNRRLDVAAKLDQRTLSDWIRLVLEGACNERKTKRR